MGAKFTIRILETEILRRRFTKVKFYYNDLLLFNYYLLYMIYLILKYYLFLILCKNVIRSLDCPKLK